MLSTDQVINSGGQLKHQLILLLLIVLYHALLYKISFNNAVNCPSLFTSSAEISSHLSYYHIHLCCLVIVQGNQRSNVQVHVGNSNCFASVVRFDTFYIAGYPNLCFCFV